MPSPESPLAGSCACGTVRFQVTSAFETAGFCHCTRCQRRAGTPWSMNGMVPYDAVEVLAGAESVTYWRPEDGMPKAFCSVCGGHVWSGEPGAGTVVGVRFGALHGDPGIEPSGASGSPRRRAGAPPPTPGPPASARGAGSPGTGSTPP